MSLITPGEAHYQVRSSRIWALVTFNVTAFFFPPSIAADKHGISTSHVGFWLTPWSRQEEHLPMTHIAEIAHDRGLIWDSVSVESSGGLNPLVVKGLRKHAASEFVTHVRALMNVKA